MNFEYPEQILPGSSKMIPMFMREFEPPQDMNPERSFPKVYKIQDDSVGSSSKNSAKGPRASCGFCKTNGEDEKIFTSHKLRDEKGNLICPVLRSYVCPVCFATGDNAHTLTYCPKIKEKSLGKPVQSTTMLLKMTKYKSNGQRRY